MSRTVAAESTADTKKLLPCDSNGSLNFNAAYLVLCSQRNKMPLRMQAILPAALGLFPKAAKAARRNTNTVRAKLERMIAIAVSCRRFGLTAFSFNVGAWRTMSCSVKPRAVLRAGMWFSLAVRWAIKQAIAGRNAACTASSVSISLDASSGDSRTFDGRSDNKKALLTAQAVDRHENQTEGVLALRR
jgi:hypothetical protein